MPLTPPVCSTPVGSTSTSCLRKFTVHFRRPPTLKQKSNYPYRGEYGFDWLREEYIYPIDTVKVNHTWGNITELYKPTILCRDPSSLRKEYKKDIEHPIAPYGESYDPAWLSIFASGVEGSANSTMHSDGVYLTLQLDEIDESFKYTLEYQSFNQALVRAEVSIEENFDIAKLAEKSRDAANFLININNPDFLESEESEKIIRENLIELYQKFGANRPKVIHLFLMEVRHRILRLY